MAFQRGPAALRFPRQVFPQRVHVADDQVWNYFGIHRVAGPAVGGHHEVGASGDGLDQAFRVWRTVKEDRGPHADL